MKRSVHASTSKPRIAELASKITDMLDEFFREVDSDYEDLDGILSDDDLDLLSDAYDVLLFAEQDLSSRS